MGFHVELGGDFSEMKIVHVLAGILGRTNIEIRRRNSLPKDVPFSTVSIISKVRPMTMTSNARLLSLIESVQYIAKHNISGAIVECGVWRGGSMMAAAQALLDLQLANRDLYLFDTFSGMVAPTAQDTHRGLPASEMLAKVKRANGPVDDSIWAYAALDDVRKNLWSTGYPRERLHFIEGPVETTLPEFAPAQIALLRLDTDWYESTRHELIHLFSRIASGGVLIIDDYGHWEGARKAVDEFLADVSHGIFLHRIDDTGRIAIIR